MEDVYSLEREYQDYDDSIQLLNLHVPHILLDSAEIEALNQTIRAAHQNQIDNALASLDEYGNPGGLAALTYEWYVNGDLLTLIIMSYYPYDDGYTNYDIYSVRISEKRPAAEEEILAAAGMSRDSYQELIRAALGSAYLNSMAPGRAHMGDEFPDWFDRTMGSENLNDTQPYLGENGDLYIMGWILIPAGGGRYPRLIDLENFEVHPMYGMDLRNDDLRCADAPEPYRSFLLEKGYLDEIYGPSMTEYLVLDVNQDGTKELILAGETMYMSYIIYTLDSANRVVPVCSTDSFEQIRYNAEQKALVCNWRMTEDMISHYLYDVFTVEGTTKKVLAYFGWSEYDDYYDINSGAALQESDVEPYLEPAQTLYFQTIEN